MQQEWNLSRILILSLFDESSGLEPIQATSTVLDRFLSEKKYCSQESTRCGGRPDSGVHGVWVCSRNPIWHKDL